MTQKKDIIYPVYMREREGKGEKCITTWKSRETRNAEVKYHLNSDAMWVVTMGIFFAYILLKIINSNLAIFSRPPSMQTEGKHPPQSHLKKTKSHVFSFIFWAHVWIHGNTEVFVPSQLVNALWGYNKHSAEKTAVSRQAHMQNEQDLLPLSFTSENTGYRTPQSVTILKLVFYYFIIITSSAGVRRLKLCKLRDYFSGNHKIKSLSKERDL